MGTKLSAGRSGVHERDAPHNDCGWSNYMGIAFVSQIFKWGQITLNYAPFQ